MTIDTSKLRLSTKSLLGAITFLGGLMQVPAVNAAVTKVLEAHPKIAPLAAAIAGIYALLHNPQVQDALGIKRTVAVTTETVQLAPEKTNESSL